MSQLNILCVHGVGQHAPNGPWQQKWINAINSAYNQASGSRTLNVRFFCYDWLFENHPLTFTDTLEAIGKLLASGISSPFRKSGARGMRGKLRWTAGMVVQWVENDQLRSQLRQHCYDAIRGDDNFSPDIILAHSLGSLVVYDTVTHHKTLDVASGKTIATFGSQICHPFVSGQFLGGRVTAIEKADHWYHWYNRHDDIFTAPIILQSPNFTQIETHFDSPGIADHSDVKYLSHPVTVSGFWEELDLRNSHKSLFSSSQDKNESSRKKTWVPRPPQHKALLIGINEYPDKSMNLEGCVNDVFLMSSVLQENNIPASGIRVVLNDRATSSNILERLDWLLSDAREGDVRFLYFSGHGAQLPVYGDGEIVDQCDEALVTYDFDWSPEKCIRDDQFYQMYTQLPYDMHFVAMFDCCHSGGLTRNPGHRIRGIHPPDDIRHRALQWDSGLQMWKPRNTPNAADAKRDPALPLARLGHSRMLKHPSKRQYNSLRKKRNHHGPYNPVLLYACREHELAYEYRHGNVSYGAFTYAFANNFRKVRCGSENIKTRLNFAGLIYDTRKDLRALNFDQIPQVEGPDVKIEAEIKI